MNALRWRAPCCCGCWLECDNVLYVTIIVSCVATAYSRRQRTSHEITEIRQARSVRLTRCSRTDGLVPSRAHAQSQWLRLADDFLLYRAFYLVRPGFVRPYVLRCVLRHALSSDSMSRTMLYSSGAFWDQDGGYVLAAGSITCTLSAGGVPSVQERERKRGVIARVTLWRCCDVLSSFKCAALFAAVSYFCKRPPIFCQL